MEEIKQIIESGLLEFDVSTSISQIGATFIQYCKFLAFLVLGVLVLSSLNRLILGKSNQINMAITAAMEILCLYVLNIVICAFGLSYQIFLSPLPYVTIAQDYLFLFPILSAGLNATCEQVLKLLMIAFLVNLIGEWIPQGQNLLTWTLLRLLTVAFAVAALFGADILIGMYVPQGFAEVAPTILIITLVVLVLLGSLKVFVGVALAFLDPIAAALYTFFFSNVIGRALARAMLSTLMISLLLLLLRFLQISVLPIAAISLTGYLPLLVVIMLLWYFVGRVLQK